MNLWVRNQENGLSQVVDILPIMGNKIIAYSINGRCISLGEYSSKERALEVLDEIQSKLDVFNKFINEPKDMFKNFFVPPIFVYEMPEN